MPRGLTGNIVHQIAGLRARPWRESPADDQVREARRFPRRPSPKNPKKDDKFS